MAAARTGSRHPGRTARASTSPTTQPSPREASATPAGTGSPATSTAGSSASPNRSRCSSANSTAATSPENCSPSTASGAASSSARLRPGSCELSDAIAHWWVLDDDHRARRREAALWASTGHAAAVYGDELYDILPQTRGGYGRLQDFGIRFGYERVVLHLEPQVDAGRLQCNTARTLLLLDHEPLPWARWGEEFAAAMPAEILRLQERAASADCDPAPGSDPQPRQRDPAALPTQPLPPKRTTPPGAASSRTTERAQPAARHAYHRAHGVTPSGRPPIAAAAAAPGERPHEALPERAGRGPGR